MSSIDIIRQLSYSYIISLREKIMQVLEIALKDLSVDPHRFQYKMVFGQDGNTGSLSGVKKWNECLAGIILVWLDSTTQKTYVINGHNRYHTALKLGVEKILCRLIDAKNSKVARVMGALTNIAENQGTCLDTAKFFRDSAYSVKQLEEFGINPKLKMVKDGLSLSNLHKHLFDLTIQGELPIDRAVILGNLRGLKEQLEVYKIIQEQSKKRKITTELVQELANTVSNAYHNQPLLFDLFGNDETLHSRAMTKLDLISRVRTRLLQSKKLHTTVSKIENAKQLESIGNFINVETNKAVSQEVTTILAIFEQLKSQVSEVSLVIDKAVTEVANGADIKKVESSLTEELIKIIPQMLKK